MGFFRRLLGTRGTQTRSVLESVPGTTARAPGEIWQRPRFAVLDVETTGLRANEHRVVEIAVVTNDLRGVVLDEWSTRVNPQGPVGATHIHGITQADVADAPVFAEVLPELNRRLAKAAVAAHNARFDLAFVRREYQRAGWDLPFVPALCTLQASEYHLPSLDRRRLADCCWAVGVPVNGAHSALGDARATASLLAAFMHPATGYPPLPEHAHLIEQAFSIEWPTSATSRSTPDSPTTRWTSPGTPATSRPLSARAQQVIARESAAPPAASLLDLIERFSLVDALDEGAPQGTLAYLEKLAEALEDGEITDDEAADLRAVSGVMSLMPEDVAAANRAFVLALAHGALADGKVSRAERAELGTVAAMLAVDARIIPALLDRAEQARHARLSEGLKPLPETWEHGAPLRVGDKVVFTGCDEDLRALLEAESERLGVRVLGTVSAKVAALVSDGSMDGGKAARARELGTRIVHPRVYRVMLSHLQPSLSRVAGAVLEVPRAAEPGMVALAESVSPLPDVVGPRAVDNPPAPSPAEVRTWARANGLEVGVRGRLPREVLQAYTSAQTGP
ncbi:exonuclease domain-containing protein [Terrabacter sp. C0L_2]|uniref:exonuclease domain-containing protein n=1 Tax=Terrabacter sp. C0L_2 TaxID=3108389 RepID=UPI001847AE91|nr:hypothetical protein [Dermatophilaceae bacterium]WVM95405.1 histone-like nucleoid-structuring protein Lsr2 [Terrabacter sp. C0L_2]